jgi:hypothetical protein
VRAYVRSIDVSHNTRALYGDSASPVRVVVGEARIDLVVVAQPEDGELARLCDGSHEIVLAPLPLDESGGVTEARIAEWAQIIDQLQTPLAGDVINPWRDDIAIPALSDAAHVLLPEVVALRREAESLRTEVKHLRAREERPYTEKLNEIAAGIDMVVMVREGLICLEPRPPDPNDYED